MAWIPLFELVVFWYHQPNHQLTIGSLSKSARVYTKWICERFRGSFDQGSNQVEINLGSLARWSSTKYFVGLYNSVTVITPVTYCWWTKSCTTKDDNDPIIFRVLTIPGGAGFLPSTVFVRYTGIITPLTIGSGPIWATCKSLMTVHYIDWFIGVLV